MINQYQGEFITIKINPDQLIIQANQRKNYYMFIIVSIILSFSNAWKSASQFEIINFLKTFLLSLLLYNLVFYLMIAWVWLSHSEIMIDAETFIFTRQLGWLKRQIKYFRVEIISAEVCHCKDLAIKYLQINTNQKPFKIFYQYPESDLKMMAKSINELMGAVNN